MASTDHPERSEKAKVLLESNSVHASTCSVLTSKKSIRNMTKLT